MGNFEIELEFRLVRWLFPDVGVGCRYVLGIDEADAFSERLTKEVIALDTANVHAILENAPIVDEVELSSISFCLSIFFNLQHRTSVKKCENMSPSVHG